MKSNKKVLVVVIVLLLCCATLGIIYFVTDGKIINFNNEQTKVGSDYRLSGNGLENFDLYFLKLENNGKNSIYSPLSIKYAMAMLADGANGNTKKQITDVIGDYKANKYTNNSNMSFANVMFIKDSYKDAVKDTYVNTLASKYNASVVYDSFANASNVNAWISDKTLNLVNNLVDDLSKTDFLLVNALGIDMNWNNQIHCETSHSIPCISDEAYYIRYAHEKIEDKDVASYITVEYPYISENDFYKGYEGTNTFNGKNNTKGATVFADFNKYDIISALGEDKIRSLVKTAYEKWLQSDEGKGGLPVDQYLDNYIKELKENYGKAAKSTDFLVYEDENVRSFAKDLKTYEGTTLQYVGIMPKKTDLKNFINNTNKTEIGKIIDSLKEVSIENFEEGYVTRIRGFIPFFKYEYELQLQEDLQKLGIKDVFTKKADLSNIATDASINKAMHKANIEFSNDGIKASAATPIGGFGGDLGNTFEYLFKVPVKEINVTFNNPYMYIIRDKATGEVWFTGTVYEPIQK